MSLRSSPSLLGSVRIGLRIKIGSIKTRPYIKSQARSPYLLPILRVLQILGPPIKAIFTLASRVKISTLKWPSLPTSRLQTRPVSCQANLGAWFKRKKRGRTRTSLTRRLMAEWGRRNGQYCLSACIISRINSRIVRFKLWSGLMKMQSVLRFSSLSNFKNHHWERILMMDSRLMRTWKMMRGYFFISNKIPCRQAVLLGRIRSPQMTEWFLRKRW